MQITEEQWKQIVRRLDAVEQSISDDRKSLDRIQIDMATIKEQNERIISMQIRSQEKTTKTVQEGMQSTNELLEEFVDKKVLKIDTKQVQGLSEKRSLWNKIKFWNRG